MATSLRPAAKPKPKRVKHITGGSVSAMNPNARKKRSNAGTTKKSSYSY